MTGIRRAYYDRRRYEKKLSCYLENIIPPVFKELCTGNLYYN